MKSFRLCTLNVFMLIHLIRISFEASMGERHKDFKEPEEISNVKSTNGPFAARDHAN